MTARPAVVDRILLGMARDIDSDNAPVDPRYTQAMMDTDAALDALEARLVAPSENRAPHGSGFVLAFVAGAVLWAIGAAVVVMAVVK